MNQNGVGAVVRGAASDAKRGDGAASEAQPAFSPPWLGGFQDLRRAHGFEPLRVTGALPGSLRGTLFRNGPGRFGVGGERYRHWFDGDGAVAAVRFDGTGHAFGAARVTLTEGLLRENRAKRRLFGAYDSPLVRPFREIFMRDGKNVANTSVMMWQDRLFALCEAGKPYEVATADLAPNGETDLDGVITTAFSAHPHYVPSRRTTYNFGLGRGRSTTVALYALPDRGSPKRLCEFPIPGARLNHDFAVTDRFAIFMFAPAFISLGKVLFGKKGPTSAMDWLPERGTEIVVVSLDEPTRIRRFHVDAFMMEHTVNAWQDGEDIVVDYTHYAAPIELEGFARSLVRGVVERPLGSSLRRLRIKPHSDAVSTEMVLDRPVELPTVAAADFARRHRVAYCVAASDNKPFDRILRHDLESGAIDEWAPDGYPGEPLPVTTSEGDFILTLVYDPKSDTSRLDVLRAEHIAEGPIASCHFDQPIPFGFHGVFNAAS